jgi:dUTPase
MPEGNYCQITSRSGLTLRQYIDAIDENYLYNGNIAVIPPNHSENPLFIYQGESTAKIISQTLLPKIEEVNRLTLSRQTG